MATKPAKKKFLITIKKKEPLIKYDDLKKIAKGKSKSKSKMA